jgi:hypothetical protein
MNYDVEAEDEIYLVGFSRWSLYSSLFSRYDL